MAISLKASVTGLELVNDSRCAKGWLKCDPQWLEASGVHRAALNRFWVRDRLNRDTFIAICNAIGVDWQEVIREPPKPQPKSTLEVIEEMKAAMIENFERSQRSNPHSHARIMERIESAKAYAALVAAERMLEPSAPNPCIDPDQTSTTLTSGNNKTYQPLRLDR